MAKMILTVEQAKDREKWLALRNKGIGGSDISAILGMSKWKSAFQLWMEKTGQAEAEDLSENEAVYWGTVLEDAVANRFCELTGKKVRRSGTLADDEYLFMLANVDRMIVGENAGLECKTASGFKLKEWDGDEVPDAYYLQCQWYMMVTGCEKWYIAVLLGGNRFVWKEIPRNDADIAAIRGAAVEFWYKVENLIMPPVDGSAGCAAVLSERWQAEKGMEVDLPSTAEAEIERLDEINEMMKSLDEQKTLAENRLKEMLQDAEVGVVGDRKVKWTMTAGRASLDSKKLKEEMPDVYQRYMTVGKPSRRFSVK